MQLTSDLEDELVTLNDTGEKAHLGYAVVIDQVQLYTDFTGIFPGRSSKGKWYVITILGIYF
jgi:hypothetical protein